MNTSRAPEPKSRPWRRLQQTGSNRGLGAGLATADAGIRYEVVPVFGQAVLTVRLKTATNGGVLDVIFVGPDFNPDQGNTAFASLVGTKYATGNPAQVAVAAGTESLIQATCLGDGYAIIKFTGSVGAGTITFCDIAMADAAILGRGASILSGAGAPTSGSSGTGAGTAIPGSLYLDTSLTPNVVYVNVGTKASPSWMALLSGDVV